MTVRVSEGTRRIPRTLKSLKTLKSLWSRIAPYYPLSFFGTVLLISGILLLGNGLLFSEGLAVAVGAIAFLLCLCLSVAVLLQPAGRLRDLLHWSSGFSLVAGRMNTSHSAALHKWELAPFLRMHIGLSARLMLEDIVLYRFHRSYCFHAAGSQTLEIFPPVPGRMQMDGEFYLSDIFGITRRRILLLEKRYAHVLPSGEPMKEFDFLLYNQSEDDAQPKRQSESEKIFIRDYQPGDRARDINWKASGRIHKLLTRISPESESPSKRARIMLMSDTAMLELAYLKSLLRGFIDRVLHNDDTVLFRIWLHDNQHEVNDEQSLDTFLKVLSNWRPNPSFQKDDVPPPDSHVIIFSHEGCNSLKSILPRYEDCHLFLVRNWASGPHDKKMSRFPGEGFMPLRFVDNKKQALASLAKGVVAGSGVEVKEYVLKKEW